MTEVVITVKAEMHDIDFDMGLMDFVPAAITDRFKGTALHVTSVPTWELKQVALSTTFPDLTR